MAKGGTSNAAKLSRLFEDNIPLRFMSDSDTTWTVAPAASQTTPTHPVSPPVQIFESFDQSSGKSANPCEKAWREAASSAKLALVQYALNMTEMARNLMGHGQRNFLEKVLSKHPAPTILKKYQRPSTLRSVHTLQKGNKMLFSILN